MEDQSPVQEKQWRKVRLDRMLVEYFLRQGYYSTAMELASSSGIEDLTNIEVIINHFRIKLYRADMFIIMILLTR